MDQKFLHKNSSEINNSISKIKEEGVEIKETPIDKKVHQEKSFISSFDGILEESLRNDSKGDVNNNNSDDKFKGIFFEVLAGISGALAAVCVKLAYEENQHLTGFDYLLCRSSILTSLAIIQVGVARVNVFDVKKGYRLILMIRCILGAIGMPAFFIALKYVPLSMATLILNIHPLFVGVLAYFFLKESISPTQIIAVLGAFLGVYLLTLHKDSEETESDYYFIGLCLVCTTCIVLAIVLVLIRTLNKKIHFLMSPFWFGITTLILAIGLLIIYPNVYNFEYYTWNGIGLFIISGAFNYGGQMFKSLGFKYADASLLAPLQYLQIVELFLFDIIVFNYKFSYLDGIGGFLILSCLLGPILRTIYLKYHK